MKAIAWIAGLDHDDELHLGRWVAAVAFVLVAHAAIGAFYIYLKPEVGITGADVPALMIEFAPEAAAPETESDLAPGPETFDSQASLQPEVKQQAADEPVIELPPVAAPEPDLVLPPKKEEVVEKQEVPQPKPPEPVETPVQQQVQSVKQPTSNPKVEKRAPKPVAPNAGTTAARNAIASYASTLSAHLQALQTTCQGTRDCRRQLYSQSQRKSRDEPHRALLRLVCRGRRSVGDDLARAADAAVPPDCFASRRNLRSGDPVSIADLVRDDGIEPPTSSVVNEALYR